MQDLFRRPCRDCGPVSLVLSLSLSALEGHGRDELIHFVGQPLLPRLFVLLQGRRDLQRRETLIITENRKIMFFFTGWSLFSQIPS